jgi:hypothetical protein
MYIPLAQKETKEQVVPTTSTSTQLAKLGASIAEKAGEQIMKTERLQTNNSLNDLQNDVAVLNQKYKSENSFNPLNEDSRKLYDEEIEKLYSEKRNGVPASFLEEYDRSFANFQSKNSANMEIWAFSQNEKNVLTDAQTGIQRDLTTAFSFGEEGNIFDAATYFESQDDLIKQNIAGLNPQTQQALYGNFKSDFYTNFINGSMKNDPEATLRLLNDKRIKEGIEPNTYKELKDATENKLMNAKNLGIKKEISNQILGNTKMTRRAIEGKASFTELYNYITENKISKPTAEYLMNLSGYKTSKDSKPDVSQQIKAKNDMYNRIDLAMEDGNIEDFRDIQNDIYALTDSNYFTQAEAENMIDMYIEPYAEKVQEATEDYSVKRMFEFGLNIGTRGINEYVDDLSIEGDDEEIAKAHLRVGLLDNFTTQLSNVVQTDTAIAESRKSRGLPQQGASVKDLEYLPKDQKIRVLNTARDDAIREYAHSLDIQTEGRPLNDVKLNIKQNRINEVRKQNYKTIDDTYKKTKQRSFVAVAFMNGQYYGQTPQGETVKISKKDYELLKGK